MEMYRNRLRALGVAAITLAAFALSGHRCAVARVANAECEGDACSQVSVTFDESRQQYRAINGSSSRWVSVAASNVAASVKVCLGPGKDAYLPLRSIEGAYRASYAEAKCGEDTAAGPPSD